jgi:hypothetical protein
MLCVIIDVLAATPILIANLRPFLPLIVSHVLMVVVLIGKSRKRPPKSSVSVPVRVQG